MPQEWFVRVDEKEYGPVDLKTLREWQAEGRLIRENPVRAREAKTWITAADVPLLFFPQDQNEPAAATDDTEKLFQRRSLGQIVAEAFRIFIKGFPQFFALALIVALPSLGFKLACAYVHYPEGGVVNRTTQIASAIAFVMLMATLAVWPIFISGLQFATCDLAAGRSIRLADILRRARNVWSRVARLCLFVYGSYLFWTALPLLAILAMAGSPSVITIFLALLALSFQVYMAGRLFINFMFWQQSSTLGGLEGVEALNESKELARSRRRERAMQRPLFRGAILASIWVLILIAMSVAVEFPFLLVRMQGITNFEDAYAMMQNLVNAPAPDGLTIATYVLSGVAHAALRPLLGIVFVVLYFDAKAAR